MPKWELWLCLVFQNISKPYTLLCTLLRLSNTSPFCYTESSNEKPKPIQEGTESGTDRRPMAFIIVPVFLTSGIGLYLFLKKMKYNPLGN